MSQQQQSYDTTVAQIAGSIATGLASVEDRRRSGQASVTELTEWVHSVATLSVWIARAIVAEVQRTEPPAGGETPR